MADVSAMIPCVFRRRSGPRLPRPDERADELAVHVADRLGAESGADENLTRALRRVDSCRLQGDLFEPGLRKLRPVLGFLEGPGNASDPQLDAAPELGRNLATHHHVGHGEAPAR